MLNQTNRRKKVSEKKSGKKPSVSKCVIVNVLFSAISTFVVVIVIIHSLHVFKFAYNRAHLEFQTVTFVNERQSEHRDCFFFGNGVGNDGDGDTIAAKLTVHLINF